MPTYEYECGRCGHRFERMQSITDAPLERCPECDGEIRRLVSGGAGFIIKGGEAGRPGSHAGDCAIEQRGQTCCGREERCDKPPCGGR
ncbi:MAG: zinc ribbon domain-containing protein [Acidobacteriota bacterium]